MAPSFVHGKGAFLSLSDNGGTTFVLSSGLDSIDVNSNAELADVTVFGLNDRTNIPGLRAHDISMSGHASSTHLEKLRPLLGHSTGTSVVWGPLGNASGARELSFSAHITQLSVGQPVGDKVSMSITATVNGAVTTGTFA